MDTPNWLWHAMIFTEYLTWVTYPLPFFLSLKLKGFYILFSRVKMQLCIGFWKLQRLEYAASVKLSRELHFSFSNWEKRSRRRRGAWAHQFYHSLNSFVRTQVIASCNVIMIRLMKPRRIWREGKSRFISSFCSTWQGFSHALFTVFHSLPFL